MSDRIVPNNTLSLLDMGMIVLCLPKLNPSDWVAIVSRNFPYGLRHFKELPCLFEYALEL